MIIQFKLLTIMLLPVVLMLTLLSTFASIANTTGNISPMATTDAKLQQQNFLNNIYAY
jgi:hypothetical protein